MREALTKAKCGLAPLFISLIDNGKNRAYACKGAGRLIFGPNETDFPGLGKRLSPFEASKLPSLEDLQKIVTNDLRIAREQYGQYSHIVQTNSTDSEDSDLRTLQSLTNIDSVVDGTVLSFPSPSLDDICGDSKLEYEDSLRESMITATVLPRNTILPLQHSNEGTTFTTLLSGSVAWIIWPPTEQNLKNLQASYETIADSLDGSGSKVANELEGGVCLVQTTHEALRIPPFCPMICLSLETSVLATHSVVTATQLAEMLRKLPLLLPWFQTETDGERKEKEFVAALLPHISAILQCKFEPTGFKKHRYPYGQDGPLRTLIQTWDDIKDLVAGILDAAETEHLKGMWEDFLRNARGRECWICGNSIQNKQRDMRTHFETAHWPTTETAGAVEKKQDTPQPEYDETVAPPFVSEAANEEAFYDAMEVIE